MRPPGDPGVSVKEPSRYGGGGGDGDPFSVKAVPASPLPRPRNSLSAQALGSAWRPPTNPNLPNAQSL